MIALWGIFSIILMSFKKLNEDLKIQRIYTQEEVEKMVSKWLAK
ncbi:MAG: hypothetical protein AB1606_05690 [Nitrospirota bacterium]